MYFSIWINAKYWKLECEDVIFFFSFELLCISRYGFFSSRLILKNFKNIRNTSCVKKFTYFCSFLNLTKISRIIQSSFIFSYKETTSINSLSLSLFLDCPMNQWKRTFATMNWITLSVIYISSLSTKSASSERVEKFSATVPLSNLVARQIGMALLTE